MPDQRPWFDSAFEGGYVEVYPHRDLACARVEVGALLERGVGGRVLDLGCGFGRHLAALRERGLDAWGLDRSRDLLARLEPGLLGRAVRGDFRALPLRSARFDSVLMLFSSFGYFDEGENACTLRELARVLVPGGLAVLDLMNAERVRRTLVPESMTRRDGLEIFERRTLSQDGRRVRKEVRVVSGDGTERSWREDVRLYAPDELRGLLESAGLEWVRTEGDFDGRSFESDSPRQIVWASRGGTEPGQKPPHAP